MKVPWLIVRKQIKEIEQEVVYMNSIIVDNALSE